MNTDELLTGDPREVAKYLMGNTTRMTISDLHAIIANALNRIAVLEDRANAVDAYCADHVDSQRDKQPDTQPTPWRTCGNCGTTACGRSKFSREANESAPAWCRDGWTPKNNKQSDIQPMLDELASDFYLWINGKNKDDYDIKMFIHSWRPKERET